MNASLMPDLVSPGLSYRHTQASAIESLLAAGVPESKISFRFEGCGGRPGLIAAQDPPPGTSHENADRVVITVSGFGLFHDLPFGMRLNTEDGDQVSTCELLGLFDSEIIRFAYWRDEAPLLFGIGPGRDEANARWLHLFGFDPDLWPKEKHFTLCSLVPVLHRIAGTEDGIRLVLRKLTGLEISEFRYRPHFVPVSTEDRNSLQVDAKEGSRTARNLRLGLDTVLGMRIEVARRCELRLGPMPLDKWRELKSEAGERQLKQALSLCMPLSVAYSYSFVVGDPGCAIQLGRAERNSVLGVNSHLGKTPWVADRETPAGEWSYA